MCVESKFHIGVNVTNHIKLGTYIQGVPEFMDENSGTPFLFTASYNVH